MNTPALFSRQVRRSSGSAAFTLIELLVVISIIAVLAGLLLPVTNSVMRNARKVSARNMEVQIVAAVNSYYTDYSQYPIPTDAAADKDFTYTVDGQHNNGQLFDVLRAINATSGGSTGGSSSTSTLNSRRIPYFEARNVKTASAPKDGFILKDATVGGVKLKAGDLVDPWGNLYGVRMDGNYSNAIDNPYDQDAYDATDANTNANSGTANADQTVLRLGVASFSYGEDAKKGNKGQTVPQPYSPTPGDDVDSWQ